MQISFKTQTMVCLLPDLFTQMDNVFIFPSFKILFAVDEILDSTTPFSEISPKVTCPVDVIRITAFEADVF